MPENPPFLNAYGNIPKVLNKIAAAATPPRFTQDFLATTLDMSGGSARPVIPFLKRTGFLGSDGVPTELYRRFRNPAERGKAVAEALKIGYRSLYEINEYVHDASDKDLLGIVVQATGLEPKSGTAKAIVASFKALKDFAKFDGDAPAPEAAVNKTSKQREPDVPTPGAHPVSPNLGLSYTINLNLPPTSDIAVFDAIFTSLKQHLLS